MMGWQWHHLDNMQIICTSFQTDMPYDSSVKALKQNDEHKHNHLTHIYMVSRNKKSKFMGTGW